MTDIADRLNDLPLRDPSKPDTEQGLFQKFVVTRTDGSSSPGGKHEGCEYFVLDIDHDPLHKPALEAYANACESTHPQLAADLRTRYRLRVPIGKPEPQGPPIYSIGERILRRRAHAFGIARDIADAFAQQENEGSTGAALFRALANKLLSEPVLVNAIADWRQAAMDAVDRVEPAPAATPRSSSHAETARKLLARNDALAVHCTLSAHHEQWWRLHREFEEQQREILQVMTDGLRARETLAERRPAAGMNLSQDEGEMLTVPVVSKFGDPMPIGWLKLVRDKLPPTPNYVFSLGFMALDKVRDAPGSVPRRDYVGRYQLREVAITSDASYLGYLRQTGAAQGPSVHATPVLLETTAMWAGAQTSQSDGAVHFTREAWEKFVQALGAEPPLEILVPPLAPCGCREGECESKPDRLCRMTQEIREGGHQ